jgi:hypothetical protein
MPLFAHSTTQAGFLNILMVYGNKSVSLNLDTTITEEKNLKQALLAFLLLCINGSNKILPFKSKNIRKLIIIIVFGFTQNIQR